MIVEVNIQYACDKYSNSIKVSRLPPDSAQWKTLSAQLATDIERDWDDLGLANVNLHKHLTFEWELGSVRSFWELARDSPALKHLYRVVRAIFERYSPNDLRDMYQIAALTLKEDELCLERETFLFLHGSPPSPATCVGEFEDFDAPGTPEDVVWSDTSNADTSRPSTPMLETSSPGAGVKRKRLPDEGASGYDETIDDAQSFSGDEEGSAFERQLKRLRILDDKAGPSSSVANEEHLLHGDSQNYGGTLKDLPLCEIVNLPDVPMSEDAPLNVHEEDAVSRVMHASGLDMKSLDTTEEVYALRAELEKTKMECDEAQLEIRRVKDHGRSLLKKEQAIFKEQFNNLKHQRDEYQKAYCDQKREVEKVKEDRSTLTELLEDERKSLKEEIECLRARTGISMQEHEVQLQNEVKLRQEAETMKARYENAHGEVQKDLDDAREAIKYFKARLKSVRQSHKAARKELDCEIKAREAVEAQLAEHVAAADVVKTEAKKCDAIKKEATHAVYSTIQSYERRLVEANNKCRDLRATARDKIRVVRTAGILLQEEREKNERLGKDLKREQADHGRTRRRMNATIAERDALNGQCTELEAAVERLNEEIKRNAAAYRGEKEQLEATIQDLQARVATERERALTDFASTMDNHQRANAELKEQLRMCQDRVKELECNLQAETSRREAAAHDAARHARAADAYKDGQAHASAALKEKHARVKELENLLREAQDELASVRHEHDELQRRVEQMEALEAERDTAQEARMLAQDELEHEQGVRRRLQETLDNVRNVSPWLVPAFMHFIEEVGAFSGKVLDAKQEPA